MITGQDAGLDGKRGQYPFQAIKFVNLVVPSPCESEPYNNVEYSLLVSSYILSLTKRPGHSFRNDCSLTDRGSM